MPTACGSTTISRAFGRSSAQIQRAEAGAADNPLPDLDRPKGVPPAYADHARLMFDLQLLAYQGDITRVITFQLARELSGRTYPEVGVPDPHHPLSHHGNDPEKVGEDLADQPVPRLAVRRASREAEGNAGWRRLAAGPHRSALRKRDGQSQHATTTTISRSSSPEAPPAGVRGGRHVRYDEGTPLANLHLTLLDRVGVRLESFGDSSGKIDDLFQSVPV